MGAVKNISRAQSHGGLLLLRQTQKLRDLHAEALLEFDEIQKASHDVRSECLQDRRFCAVPGAQWEGSLGDQFENKPRFEFNKTHLAVIRIVNEYRNNRITVDFQSRDGSSDDTMADACDGLYRADERSCSANEAYDNAFEEAAQGGIGAWRVRACYEDEDDDENERQRVRMEPIFDADTTVFFDQGAKRQDKSDSKRCWVLIPYSRRAYKDEFDEDPADWPKSHSGQSFDWASGDLVWVCEHYRIEETTELVRYYRGLDPDAPEMRVSESEFEADPAFEGELQAQGFRLVREKRVKRKQCRKYLLSGSRILKDCGLIAGGNIPIVITFGKRWVVDGVERCMGHVRLAKDAQRLENLLMSWLAEMATRFDIEKPIVTPEQIAGHALMWAEDNVRKFPYLLLNPVTDENGNRQPAGPIAYTKAPNVPPAMAALAQMATQALQDLLGNAQAGEQLQPNLSGKAVELIQNRLDMQVFIYMSNFAKAMKRCGEIWLAMMKEIVVERERKMKALDQNGVASTVVLNQPAYDKETGAEFLKNDVTKATFEVDVDVGPSSSSRRAATVRALTGVMQFVQDPETVQVVTSLLMLNIEGEGMGDVNEHFRRKMVRAGVVKPTEDEERQMAEEQANQQPDPQAQYLLAAAEQASADAATKRAKTVETIASADLKRAQTAKTYAEAEGEANTQQLASTMALRDLLEPRGPSNQQL